MEIKLKCLDCRFFSSPFISTITKYINKEEKKIKQMNWV